MAQTQAFRLPFRTAPRVRCAMHVGRCLLRRRLIPQCVISHHRVSERPAPSAEHAEYPLSTLQYSHVRTQSTPIRTFRRVPSAEAAGAVGCTTTRWLYLCFGVSYCPRPAFGGAGGATGLQRGRPAAAHHAQRAAQPAVTSSARPPAARGHSSGGTGPVALNRERQAHAQWLRCTSHIGIMAYVQC